MSVRGDQTRNLILRKAARLFNEQGYSGASLSDVMKATGLQKGGLYNHFSSKEDLAVAAFDYAVHQVMERFSQLIAGKTTAPDRLLAIIDGFYAYYDEPPLPGGCPIMNTAIENDDSNAALRARAREAMQEYFGGICAIVKGGIKRGELRPDVDPEEAAAVMLSSFEGALMLSRLNRNPAYLERVTAFLRSYVNGLVKE